MPLIVLIVVLVLLFGGGGAYYGPRAGWGAPHYGGGLLGLIVLILLLLWLTGNLGGGRAIGPRVERSMTSGFYALSQPAANALEHDVVVVLTGHVSRVARR